MTLFDQILASSERVRTAGRRAIRELKDAGVPAYYTEKPGGPMIMEMPDGTRIPLDRSSKPAEMPLVYGLNEKRK